MITAIVCGAIALALMALMWRGYKDPANWRIDVERGGIRFNQWKEIWLSGLMLTLVLVLLLTLT